MLEFLELIRGFLIRIFSSVKRFLNKVFCLFMEIINKTLEYLKKKFL